MTPEVKPMSKPEGVKIATIEAKTIPASEAPKSTPHHQHPQRESIEDPRKIIRQGLLVVFLFFGVLGTWAVFGEISGAIVAPGKVKIETERKTVQHLEGGIVDSILVREGDEVQEGQPLIVLESVQVDASENMLQKQLVALLAAQTRSAAEKELKTNFAWPEELLSLAASTHSEDVLANERKIFTARREALDGQISLLKSQIAQIDAQILGYQDQMQAEQAIIGTLNEELKAKRQLYAERYLEKSQILELERMLASHEGNRGRMRQSIAEARQKKAELLLRIEDAKNRFVEEATNQLGKLDNEILQTLEGRQKTTSGRCARERPRGRAQGPLQGRRRAARRTADGHRARKHAIDHRNAGARQQDHRCIYRAGSTGAARRLRYAHHSAHPG